jgi:NAD-dependent dihydropyrimidine dehydrogenase PreA subunit
MAFVISEPCVGSKEGSCVEVCPVDCIKSTPDAEQYYIDPVECISCGACMDVCPSKAIFPADLVPEQWRADIEKNRAFFHK